MSKFNDFVTPKKPDSRQVTAIAKSMQRGMIKNNNISFSNNEPLHPTRMIAKFFGELPVAVNILSPENQNIKNHTIHRTEEEKDSYLQDSDDSIFEFKDLEEIKIKLKPNEFDLSDVYETHDSVDQMHYHQSPFSNRSHSKISHDNHRNHHTDPKIIAMNNYQIDEKLCSLSALKLLKTVIETDLHPGVHDMNSITRPPYYDNPSKQRRNARHTSNQYYDSDHHDSSYIDDSYSDVYTNLIKTSYYNSLRPENEGKTLSYLTMGTSILILLSYIRNSKLIC